MAALVVAGRKPDRMGKADARDRGRKPRIGRRPASAPTAGAAHAMFAPSLMREMMGLFRLQAEREGAAPALE